mmetsp:Transcript_2537/g.4330  ORF Transcript_2537/g.4330 Transcript_2537/m.4330 type:complete len:329 (-) Transcript_2537:439-1425(-)
MFSALQPGHGTALRANLMLLTIGRSSSVVQFKKIQFRQRTSHLFRERHQCVSPPRITFWRRPRVITSLVHQDAHPVDLVSTVDIMVISLQFIIVMPDFCQHQQLQLDAMWNPRSQSRRWLSALRSILQGHRRRACQQPLQRQHLLLLVLPPVPAQVIFWASPMKLTFALLHVRWAEQSCVKQLLHFVARLLKRNRLHSQAALLTTIITSIMDMIFLGTRQRRYQPAVPTCLLPRIMILVRWYSVSKTKAIQACPLAAPVVSLILLANPKQVPIPTQLAETLNEETRIDWRKHTPAAQVRHGSARPPFAQIFVTLSFTTPQAPRAQRPA